MQSEALAPSKRSKRSTRAGMQNRAGSTRRKRDAVEKGIARERRAINLFKTSKGRNLSLREQLEKAHRRYGHVAPKRLVGFKKKGRIYSSLIPDKGRLEFKAKHCPICLAMKGKKPGKPSKLNLHDKTNLSLWEKVCVDTAGKFGLHLSERIDITRCLSVPSRVGNCTFLTRKNRICRWYFSSLSLMSGVFRRSWWQTEQARF